MRIISGLVLLLAGVTWSSMAQTLNLAPRMNTCMDASDLANFMALLPLPPDPRRENIIYAQVMMGNVPDWMKKLVMITTNAVINGTNHTVSYYVTPDYLCLGGDTSYLFMPMTPMTAQRIANALNCTLPTRKMVNDIWAQAQVKMTPDPIPPSAAMTTIPVFVQHNGMVWRQRQASLAAHPFGSLVAGDKKDVVISTLIYTNLHRSSSPVVIYGWNDTNGVPIQPLYNGHAQTWADYSHGIRLVQDAITVDGVSTTVAAVLTNPALAALLSDETNFPGNVIPTPYYPIPPNQ